MEEIGCELKDSACDLHSQTFIAGDLYLFHSSDPHCPPFGSLWGICDNTEADVICLESSTLDMQHFFTWRRLPEEYRYCRLATRDELPDYIFNLACYECRLTRAESKIKRAEVSAAY